MLNYYNITFNFNSDTLDDAKITYLYIKARQGKGFITRGWHLTVNRFVTGELVVLN